MNTFLNHALAYSKLGWSVIPIEPRGKKPLGLMKWKKYQQERASINQIKSWWSSYPLANIGIVTGQISGIIVVDIDSQAGRRAYLAIFRQLHHTTTQLTGRGLHLVFKHPGDQKYKTTKIYTDIDIKADGGYIIVSPSIHPNGTCYKWAIPPSSYLLPGGAISPRLPELPEEIKNRLQNQTFSERKSQNPNGWMQEALLGVKQGQRNNTCAKLAGYYLRLFIGDIRETEKVLFEWNKRNRPPLTRGEVIRVIESVRRTRKLNN